MQIWTVEFDKNVGISELDCCWTKKEDAENYLKGEAERCGWTLEKIGNDWDDYRVIADNSETFEVSIYPMFLDEKPYF